jgi:hypothetical protein
MELLTDTNLVVMCNLLKIPLRHIGLKDSYVEIGMPTDGAYIVNLDSKSTNKKGTHWTSFLLVRGKALYFDSYGLTIPLIVRDFILKYEPTQILFSTNQIQSLNSIFCGYFSLYFLYFFTVLHKHNPNIIYLLNKHNALYINSNRNRNLNDRIIQQLIKGIFKN